MLGVPAQYMHTAPVALQARPPRSSRDTAVPCHHQVNNGKTQAKSDNRNSWVLRKGGDCADDVAVGHGPCCRAAAAQRPQLPRFLDAHCACQGEGKAACALSLFSPFLPLKEGKKSTTKTAPPHKTEKQTIKMLGLTVCLKVFWF